MKRNWRKWWRELKARMRREQKEFVPEYLTDPHNRTVTPTVTSFKRAQSDQIMIDAIKKHCIRGPHE